jgi:hypothetical protein
MAMALAELGRFDEAVKWQQSAIDDANKTGNPGMASRLNDNLQRYLRRMPCRTPWRDNDPVFYPRPER